MAIRAEAVEILVSKSRFEPEVALGVAEAIEVSITLAQLVTVPVLDARLHELRHEFKADVLMLKGEIQAVRTDFKAEMQSMRAEFKAEMQAMRVEFKAEMQAMRAEFKADIQTVRSDFKAELAGELGKMRTEMHAIKSELVRWVFLTMLGSVALSTSASAILKVLAN